MTRFDEFQKSLGIAPNILTSRLNGLGLTQPPNHGSHAHSSDSLKTQKNRAVTTPTRIAGPITRPHTTLSMRSVRSMRDSTARDMHWRTAPAATP